MNALDPGGLVPVLEEHARRYPLMSPQDGVKLVYQNEFGGGHLIANPAESLDRIQREWEAVPRDFTAPMLEDIGGGMVRVRLEAVDREDYPLEELNRDFVRSAARVEGSWARFLEKLAILRQLAEGGRLPFPLQALDRYLEGCLAAGCRPVSHSPGYRAAYHPAYRVLRRSAAPGLLARELRLLARERPLVLAAIDGRCASGKTTLAARLGERWGWPVVHMDHFFLRSEQRTPERYNLSGENVDHERFLEEVLRPLRERGRAVYRPYDCRAQALTGRVEVGPAPVILVEGSYSCHRALWDYYDLHVFLTVDREEQLSRLRAREGEAYTQVFQDRWIPLEEAYFSDSGLQNRCDFVFEL